MTNKKLNTILANFSMLSNGEEIKKEFRRMKNKTLPLSLFFLFLFISSVYIISLNSVEVELASMRLPEIEDKVYIIQGADDPIDNERLNEIVDDMIMTAILYRLDSRLLIGMAKLESQLGTKMIAGTNNWYGVLHGKKKFETVKAGTHYVAWLITKSGYYKKFQRTGDLCDMTKIYATDPNYCEKLKNIINNLIN